MTPARLLLGFAALSGFVATAMGAFAAHALRGRLSAEAMGWLETGVRYQMYHALALLLVAVAIGRFGDARWLVIGGWFFVAGIVLFSGSLYLMALTGWRGIAWATPFGGLALLAGWLLLALAVFRRA